MKHFVFIVSLLMLASCASTRHASTTRIDRDSTYHYARQLDSLYRAFWQRDSVYQRDSTYVLVKGDTVTKYVEKELYRWRARTDTVYRDRLRVDTTHIERVDSVQIKQPVYIEKQIKWYNQGFIWLGKLCCLAAIIYALFLCIRRKI